MSVFGWSVRGDRLIPMAARRAAAPTQEPSHSGQEQSSDIRFASSRVKIDDTLTIHYQQAGSGSTTIIFIPGWMMSTEVFEHQLAHFEGSTEYRALAYDPRCQDKSSTPVEGHTYQQHARDLARLLEELELEHVILAGWSYGVTEQLAYVNQFGTEKVKAMIMIDTGPKISGATRDEWIWYLNDDSDGYSRSFTEGIIENRKNVIRNLRSGCSKIHHQRALNGCQESPTKHQVASRPSQTPRASTLTIAKTSGHWTQGFPCCTSCETK